jgi:hypothetical protein
MNSPDAIFCDQCGAAIPNEAYADQLAGAPVTIVSTQGSATSSSGRRPVVVADHSTSPAGREAYLRSLADAHRAAPPVQRGTFLERLGDAERAVELCEADLEEAAGDLLVARQQMPEHAHSRSLNPADRSAVLRFQQAEAGHAKAVQAHARARATLNLNRMLSEYDAISRPDLGLVPGPESDTSWMWPGQ